MTSSPKINLRHALVDVSRLIDYVAFGFKGLHPVDARKL